MLDQVLGLVAAFGLATGVTRSTVVYALTSASHVLGIALLIGPILLVDLRLLGWLQSLNQAAIITLRRTATCGALLALSSGFVLFSARPFDYAANRVFLAKLVVITAALANALMFEWRMRRAPTGMTLSTAPLFGVASIALWISALLLGRWIAFV